jgi:hypothetical protein
VALVTLGSATLRAPQILGNSANHKLSDWSNRSVLKLSNAEIERLVRCSFALALSLNHAPNLQVKSPRIGRSTLLRIATPIQHGIINGFEETDCGPSFCKEYSLAPYLYFSITDSFADLMLVQFSRMPRNHTRAFTTTRSVGKDLSKS